MDPTEGERRLLVEILRASALELLEQIDGIKVEARTFTGAGVLVELSAGKRPTLSGRTGYLGSEVYLTAEGLPGIFQVHIGVRNGCIECLEISATDGDWFPDNLEAFTICRFEVPSAETQVFCGPARR